MKGPRAKRSKSQFARNTFFTDTQMCRKQPNRSPKVEIDNSQELYGVRQSLGKTFHLREQNDRGCRPTYTRFFEIFVLSSATDGFLSFGKHFWRF